MPSSTHSIHWSKNIAITAFATLILPLSPPAMADWRVDLAKDIFKGVVVAFVVEGVKSNIAEAKSNKEISNAANTTMLADFAKIHFRASSDCDIDKAMQLYSSNVYYENISVDWDYIKRTMTAYCGKYSGDASYNIRPGSMFISSVESNNKIKVIDYITDWNVYSLEKQERIRGATSVKVVVDTSSSNLKIIGQSHRRLSTTTR